LTALFAAALTDTRDPVFTRRELLTLVRQWTSGVLAE
jgi:hypothetical protein